MCNFCQTEIITDVVILDYQQAINANRYMAQEYPKFAGKLWLFAHSGCGDEWFLHKQTGQVWFYDHDQGEYSSLDDFVVFLVGFIEFIELIAELKVFELNKDYIGNPQEYFEKKIHPLNPLFLIIILIRLFE